MKEKDMQVIADCIAAIVNEGEKAISAVAEKVAKLCKDYPLYANDVNL